MEVKVTQRSEILQEILKRTTEFVLEQGGLSPGGLKIAGSFAELEQIIGWEGLKLQFGINSSLREVCEPLFQKDYLQLSGSSIRLTLYGYIIGSYYLKGGEKVG